MQLVCADLDNPESHCMAEVLLPRHVLLPVYHDAGA